LSLFWAATLVFGLFICGWIFVCLKSVGLLLGFFNFFVVESFICGKLYYWFREWFWLFGEFGCGCWLVVVLFVFFFGFFVVCFVEVCCDG